MGWTKERKTRKALPVGVVTVSIFKKGHARVQVGKATVDEWRLSRYPSLDILTNEENSSLLGFQLREDNEGEFRMSPNNGGSMFVSCSRQLEKIGAQPGHYKLKRDPDTFLILDTVHGRVRE